MEDTYMNKISFLLPLSASFVCCAQDYNPIEVYAETLYNILDDYTQTDTSLGSDELRLCLQGEASKTIFGNAAQEGYTQQELIKATYRFGTQQDPANRVVMKTLGEDIRQHNMW